MGLNLEGPAPKFTKTGGSALEVYLKRGGVGQGFLSRRSPCKIGQGPALLVALLVAVWVLSCASVGAVVVCMMTLCHPVADAVVGWCRSVLLMMR